MRLLVVLRLSSPAAPPGAEGQILRALRINLKTRGYEDETTATGVDALASAARRMPDVVLLDLGLPDMDGSEVIQGLRGWTDVVCIGQRPRSAVALCAYRAVHHSFPPAGSAWVVLG